MRAFRNATWLAVSLVAAATHGAENFAVEKLPTPTRGSGTTLFTALPPTQTGLVASNAYDDPRMWAERFQEFKFGAIGTGVAIGDYDSDGRPDVFVVQKTGSGRLFRNLGNWKFEDVTEKAGLAGATGASGWVRSFFSDEDPKAWVQGATWADVNNDGRLDLFVGRLGAPNRLWINLGESAGSTTFKEEAQARGLALSDASGAGAFADFDRDGWLDVYVQTNLLDAKAQPEGQEDRLYRNKGDGYFEDVTTRAGIRGRSQGHAAIWWDYDEDGWPDLYVANDFAPADRLYRNLGNGTFRDVIDAVVPRTPHSAMGADLGDVNNDGHIDFLVADMAATSVEKDQRGMSKIRALLAKMNEDATESPQFMQNALYLNTGLGRMREAAQFAGLAATDWTWSVRLEDLDCDGWVDVHVTNGMVRELHNADLVQAISAAESSTEAIRIERDSPVFAERNLAFRNRGDLRFEETGAAWGLDQDGVSFGASFGDLDGDGDLDLIIANYDAPPTVLRNDAKGNRLVVGLRGTRTNRFGIGAVVRIRTTAGAQVRTLVSSRGYLSSSEPVLHFGLGELDRVAELSVEWPGGGVQRFNDVAANQRIVITEPSASGPAVSRANDPGQTFFVERSGALGLALASPEEPPIEPDAQPLLPFRFNRRGPALAAPDIDADGRDDLVLGGTVKSPLRWGKQAALPPAKADDGPLLLLDFDGDGGADLLRTKAGASRSGDYQPVIWRKDGGRFSPTEALPTLAISVGAAVAADFDRDGDLDIFLGARNLPGRFPQAPTSALLRNDGGRFTDVTDDLAKGLRNIGMVTSALWTDANDDGWLDLLLALDWGPLRLFINEAGAGLTDQSGSFGFRATRTGLWTSLSAADFNEDGRLDYVAGNIGLNTPYRAPAVLFAGDFRGGSAPQLVEARVESGKLYPVRSRQELGALVPTILRKYPKNDAFARAPLLEILGADRLAAAQKLEAVEFQSGVWLSRPPGGFEFVALPASAQLAPLQGIVAGDFDADGHADVLAVQNSFAPMLPTGRFDGGTGVFLRGDGRGGFAELPPDRSGFLVAGDAKALVAADLDADGAAEFIATRNQATALVFSPLPREGFSQRRIILKGAAGNPTAIGARIVVEYVSGAKQVLELAAGGGYYSQSAAGIFVAYQPDNPPRRVSVRWPDGAATEHAWTDTGAVMQISR